VLGASAGRGFVVGPNGTLAIAPLPADAPSNEYVHPVLGEGGPVRTAGNIRIDREGESVVRVVVDQDSKSYCPTAESLSVALEALSNLGIAGGRLRVENHPPVCVGAEPAPAEGPRYAALMAEVGTRFERMGRAARAGRFELAEFERGEIEEIFDEELPKAELPRESAGVNLAGVAQAFAQTNLPDLKKAIESKDPSAIKRAYALASETCNGCHRTSGHAFVEIPGQPGQPVPRLDPLQQR
jgi:cytochrome c556